jgi:hypothetical protein
MDSSINGNSNKGGDIKKRGKVTIQTIDGLPYRMGKKEQFRNRERLYGTIENAAIVMPRRERLDSFRPADQKKSMGRCKKIGETTPEISSKTA